VTAAIRILQKKAAVDLASALADPYDWCRLADAAAA
jgi:hypothetical protein